MKTLLITTLGAFVITLVFVAGGYTLYRIEVNFTVSVDGFALVVIFNRFQQKEERDHFLAEALMPVSLSNCYLYLSTYLL